MREDETKLDTDGLDSIFASLIHAAAVPTRAAHAAPSGAAAAGQPLQASSLWRPPGRLVEASIVGAQQRRDSSGQRFGSFTIRSHVETGSSPSAGGSAPPSAAASVIECERRYSDFVALHAEVHVALALPEAFPVAASVLTSLSTREQQLQEYLHTAVSRAKATGAPLSLLAFLRPHAFTATALAPTECLAAIPTAGCVTALSILRAHTGNETLQRAALERIRHLAEHGDDAFTGGAFTGHVFTDDEFTGDAFTDDAAGGGGVQGGAAGDGVSAMSDAMRGDGKAVTGVGGEPFIDGPFRDGPIEDGPFVNRAAPPALSPKAVPLPDSSPGLAPADSAALASCGGGGTRSGRMGAGSQAGRGGLWAAGGAGRGVGTRSEADGGRQRDGALRPQPTPDRPHSPSTDGRAPLPATAADAAQAALIRAGAAEALTAALRRMVDQPAAAAACAALRPLAIGTRAWQAAARASLERAGLIQPLVEAMGAQPAHPALLASAADLITALTCTSRDPHGVSSHFAFEAARLIAAAMAEHPSHLHLQSACCQAAAALAARTTPLGHVLATGGATAACVAAMRRFRSASHSAASLQAHACAALSSLAVHSRTEMDRIGGLGLFISTIGEHGSDSVCDAAVVVNGWTAILVLLEPPHEQRGAPDLVGPKLKTIDACNGASTGEAQRPADPPLSLSLDRLSPHLVRDDLLPMLWRCLRVHSRRAAVLCACAAVLAALLREDARREAAGRADLGCCADAHAMHALLHSMGLFFFSGPDSAPNAMGGGLRGAGSCGVDSIRAHGCGSVGSQAPPSLVRHVSRACEAVVAIGVPRGWFAHHELRVLHSQLCALGDAAGERGEEHASALQRIDDALAAAAPTSRARARA
jgi:hypothetical protein